MYSILYIMTFDGLWTVCGRFVDAGFVAVAVHPHTRFTRAADGAAASANGEVGRV
jgi:hypothetical protein